MTASRMLSRGELLRLGDTAKRPAVLALAMPAQDSPAPVELASVLTAWGGSVRMRPEDSNRTYAGPDDGAAPAASDA